MAMNLGNVGLSVSGLLVRTSTSSEPKRELRSAATAMIRYVVSDSGNVTSTTARPSALVVTDPSQNARTRKSRRTVPAPSSPPPPPSLSPFGVSTRRETIRWRLSSLKT